MPRRLPIGLLPNSIIRQIIGALQPLKDSLDQIRDFSIEQGSPIKARDELVTQYCAQADRFFGAALLYNCLTRVLEGRRLEDYNCLACILEIGYPFDALNRGVRKQGRENSSK